MEGISATVNSMGQNSGLLSSLTDWNSTLAGYADSISTGVVMPVALTLLALFMILELYNATQRIAMNGSNNAFTIQQIALVMLKIVVCRWAVVHENKSVHANDVEQLRREFLELKADYLERVVKLLRKIY